MSQSYATELKFMFAAASALWLDTPVISNKHHWVRTVRRRVTAWQLLVMMAWGQIMLQLRGNIVLGYPTFSQVVAGLVMVFASGGGSQSRTAMQG